VVSWAYSTKSARLFSAFRIFLIYVKFTDFGKLRMKNSRIPFSAPKTQQKIVFVFWLLKNLEILHKYITCVMLHVM